MCAHAPCVRQRYDPGPTPLCGLGDERLGRSVAISVNCPARLPVSFPANTKHPTNPFGRSIHEHTPYIISIGDDELGMITDREYD